MKENSEDSLVKSHTSAVMNIYDDFNKIYFGPEMTTKSSIMNGPEDVRCKIVMLQKAYMSVTEAFAFPKDSEFLSIFSYYIIKMRENGFLEKVVSKYLSKQVDLNNCQEELVIDEKVVLPLFIFLVAIISFSILIAVYNYATFLYKKKRKNKTKRLGRVMLST